MSRLSIRMTRPRRTRRKRVKDAHGALLAETGSGNVLADLGFRDADKEVTKARLAAKIEDVIARRALTQAQAGAILGLPQPKVSLLLNGGWGSYSIERLTRYLNKLGVNVRVTLSDRPRWSEGRTTVAAAE